MSIPSYTAVKIKDLVPKLKTLHMACIDKKATETVKVNAKRLAIPLMDELLIAVDVAERNNRLHIEYILDVQGVAKRACEEAAKIVADLEKQFDEERMKEAPNLMTTIVQAPVEVKKSDTALLASGMVVYRDNGWSGTARDIVKELLPDYASKVETRIANRQEGINMSTNALTKTGHIEEFKARTIALINTMKALKEKHYNRTQNATRVFEAARTVTVSAYLETEKLRKQVAETIKSAVERAVSVKDKKAPTKAEAIAIVALETKVDSGLRDVRSRLRTLRLTVEQHQKILAANVQVMDTKQLGVFDKEEEKAIKAFADVENCLKDAKDVKLKDYYTLLPLAKQVK